MTPARGQRHWLVKTEPSVYSIDDLQRDGSTAWDGVRNFQARNTLRDEMHVGDLVLVYHSSAEPMCIAGVSRVARAGYPDATAFDKKDPHFDPKSKRDNPTWFVVDLAHVQTYPAPLERDALKDEPALADMVLLQRGSRLSVQPVTAAEFAAVQRLAKQAARAR